MTLISKNFSEVITFSRGTGATRVNSAGLIVGVDFSATSNTIATGSKTFTITADANVNRDWPVGSNVIAVSQAGATGSMTGTVTSYTPSTQALVINVTSVTGSGTSTDWRIGSLDVREDYDPVTLVRRGVLSEVAATNVSLGSDDLSGYTGTAVTETPNFSLSPSGSNNARRLQGTGATSVYQRAASIIAGRVYTISVYVKAANAGVNATFRLLGDGNLSSADMTATANFTRYKHTFTAVTGGSRQHGLARPTTNADWDIVVFGFFVEEGTDATSYIPTTTAQVTRNADNFPLTAAAVASIRQGEGTLYAEIDCPDTGVAQKRALRLSGTNADIRIGKQGTGTLSNFTKMAEGAGLRLMGTANSLIRGNGQEMLPVTAIDQRTGTATTTLATNAVAFNGANQFALACNTFASTLAAEEATLDSALTGLSGKGTGAITISGVHYNGNRFLMSSSNAAGVVFLSDGTSYRRINTPVITQGTNEITSGLVGGTLRNVIVGNAGFIATSDDNGETWTARTSGVATAFNAVEFGGGTFVAVNATAANSRYSTNGIDWLAVTGIVGSALDIIYTGSQFVAVNSVGGVFTSTDGIAFTAVTTTGITPTFTAAPGITFSNGFYVIVGNAGQVAISQTGAAASPATWTTFVTAQTGTSSQLNEVLAFSGSFYAIGQNQTVIKFDQSLTPTFTSQTAGVAGSLNGIAASPTTLLITGSAGAMASSTDGTNFTSRTNNSATLNGIAFGNNVFVSVGNAVNGSGYIATIGADGTVTRRVSGLTQSVTNTRFLNNRFWFTHSYDGTNALRSTTDFSTISTHNIGVMNANDIAFDGASTFVVVGNSTNNCSVSTNGASTFTAFRVGNIADIFGVAFGAGVFVLVGTAGSIYSSPTGLNGSWTLRTSGTTQTLNSVIYSTRDSLWYAAGASGVLLYSPDAITWTAVQNSGTASILGTTLQSSQPLPQFKSGVNKIALSYKQNQVIAALNGVASTTDTTATIPSITAGTIGENFNGTIQKIEVLDSALTTSEIIEKTL